MLMSSMTPLKSANGPVTTRTCSPTSHSGLKRGFSSPLPPCDAEDPLDLPAGEGCRLGAAGDEPGDTGRVAHGVPGVVVEGHPHEDVAGETFFWTTTFLPPLNSTTSSIGMTTSKIRSSMCIDWMRVSRFALTLFSYPE